MSTDTLEHVDVDTTTEDDDGEEPEVAHYFSKKDLARVVSEWATITALCGWRGQPLVVNPDLPMCQKCHDIHARKDPE